MMGLVSNIMAGTVYIRCMCVCVCMLILYACLVKAVPYQLCSCRIVCVRLHQYDMSLMWKYKERKPSQPHSSPQQDTSTTVPEHTCVFEFERERERRELEKGKHKEPQATTSSKSLAVFFLFFLNYKQFWAERFWAKGTGLCCGVESILYVNAVNKHCHVSVE